ncbi:hypothetical protein Cva_00751 [Caedimonas varicaedens]|uniref:Uncharacterized protein n=1 Tax=Caedimonas varicaedens TaxID=1629334 RepID=A0A0K8MD13_9PROT|nr:hypothetical protein Cva_00751 [Caedimonas varicaedens]
MSKPLTWLWLPQNKEAFCKAQDLAEAGTLVFNGTNPPSALAGVLRTISLTSDQDLSAVKITCTGMMNGQMVSETLNGPNGETIETKQIFDTLTSVGVSDKVKNLSVGTGTTGQTSWVLFDYQRTFPSLSAQVVILDGTAKYSLMGTLSNPAQTADMTQCLFVIANDMKEKEESALVPVMPFPVRYVCVQILEGEATTSLEITFLQQGVV